MKRQQKGFTLVEIAVVLVIIGLLLGGVLKGQELIASARVRSMADQQSGIQAAYFGFQDRYRAIPGDMPADAATDAIGQPISLGASSSNGQLAAPSATGNPPWSELNGVWEQMSKAGFIQGSYDGDNGNSPPDSSDGPINVFNGQVILARHSGYQDLGSNPAARLLLHLGQNVPVDIARELDVKVDDGQPRSGTLRNAATGSEIYNMSDSAESCVEDPSDDDPIWDITDDSQNCNPTFLF